MPKTDTIHVVKVVPTFAPMMTAIAWASVISPALTELTAVMVVADELWTKAVAANPENKARNLLPLISAMMPRR